MSIIVLSLITQLIREKEKRTKKLSTKKRNEGMKRLDVSTNL